MNDMNEGEGLLCPRCLRKRVGRRYLDEIKYILVCRSCGYEAPGVLTKDDTEDVV